MLRHISKTYHDSNNPRSTSPFPPKGGRYRLTGNKHDPKRRDSQVQIVGLAADICCKPLGLSVPDIAAVETIEEVQDGEEGEEEEICLAVDSPSEPEEGGLGSGLLADEDRGRQAGVGGSDGVVRSMRRIFMAAIVAWFGQW